MTSTVVWMAIVLAVVASCSCTATPAAPAAAKKPNFILLFVDDMGVDQIQVTV